MEIMENTIPMKALNFNLVKSEMEIIGLGQNATAHASI